MTPWTEFRAVENRWPHDPNGLHPELNTAVARIDHRECGDLVNVIARACNAETAHRIACALGNCGYLPSELVEDGV